MLRNGHRQAAERGDVLGQKHAMAQMLGFAA
jgi:hypothetical protein